jgi:hypothetical protein
MGGSGHRFQAEIPFRKVVWKDLMDDGFAVKSSPPLFPPQLLPLKKRTFLWLTRFMGYARTQKNVAEIDWINLLIQFCCLKWLFVYLSHMFEAALPDFSCYIQLTKTLKLYQITIKYTKKPLNMPNGYKIDQMAIQYTNIFHRKTLQNFPIWQPRFEELSLLWRRRHVTEWSDRTNLRLLSDCLLWASFLTITEVAQIFGLLFSPGKSYVVNFRQTFVGQHLGTVSQTWLLCLLCQTLST